jgi:hypothetical protein
MWWSRAIARRSIRNRHVDRAQVLVSRQALRLGLGSFRLLASLAGLGGLRRAACGLSSFRPAPSPVSSCLCHGALRAARRDLLAEGRATALALGRRCRLVADGASNVQARTMSRLADCLDAAFDPSTRTPPAGSTFSIAHRLSFQRSHVCRLRFKQRKEPAIGWRTLVASSAYVLGIRPS